MLLDKVYNRSMFCKGDMKMEFVRKVVNSDYISSIIDLPSSFKGKKVEIIVLPVAVTRKKENIKKSLMGALRKYADKSLIEKEKTAWQKAVEEKYAHS